MNKKFSFSLSLSPSTIYRHTKGNKLLKAKRTRWISSVNYRFLKITIILKSSGNTLIMRQVKQAAAKNMLSWTAGKVEAKYGQEPQTESQIIYNNQIT